MTREVWKRREPLDGEWEMTNEIIIHMPEDDETCSIRLDLAHRLLVEAGYEKETE